VQPKQIDNAYFNEIHDSDGNVWTHYKIPYSQWRSMSASKRKQLHRSSKKLFSGDYFLDPLPRIITNSEFCTLKKGVRQRAEAIRCFLWDYYGGGKRWMKIIPPATLKSIITRNHDNSVFGKLKLSAIAFPFGPDIIRDKNGKWRVVEDSAGCLGGIGDLLESRKIMFKLMPSYQSIFKDAHNPKDFFVQLAARFQKKAEQKGGIPLLYLGSFETEEDNETRRLGKLFESLGIEVATTESATKQLLIESDGIFLQTARRKKRVGYMAFRTGPEHMVSHCLSLGLKTTLARKTMKMGFPEICQIRQVIQCLKGISIQSALLKNHAWTNFSPGVQFINDKMFGLYVDSFIIYLSGI